jgi:hypothetical protein
VIYAIGATPQDITKVLSKSLLNPEVPDCAATAVMTDETGTVVSMASLSVVGPYALPDILDYLTTTMNNRQEEISLMKAWRAASDSVFSIAAAAYYSWGPTYSWAGQVNKADGTWIGRVEEYFVGHFLFNDSDPNLDHWVLEARQTTDPGFNHGTPYQTKEVRNKFNKLSPVTYIGDFQPQSTSGGTIIITCGYPPSVSYSYPNEDVTILNQSTSSYARWINQFRANSNHAKYSFTSRPAYQNDVPPRGTLKAYCYVTTEFAQVNYVNAWWDLYTNNWSPFTLSLTAPSS